MRIFDTHAHYDDKAFEEDRDILLPALHRQGVEFIVNMSSDPDSLSTTLAMADQYPFVYGAIGIHPEYISSMTEEIYERMDGILQTEASQDIAKIVAVGEIGLDYHWYPEEKELQKYWLARQISLAKKYGLPVAIHSRDAAEDTFRSLAGEHAEDVGGVIHSYSGSAQMAAEYVKMGFFIGVGGVVTFKNGKKPRKVVEEIPLDHIVIETDCPYMSPEPFRGRRNHSANLVYVAEEIARIKGLTSEEVQKITLENGKRLYHLAG